ncbi:MAG TPA: hypothetical protein PLE45_01670 [Spirochaetota bacterium]|nr:hypothetical protein [Spirochaetota bacterium]HPP03759.1 hypothetical protein [Spirochaetota bacterium]
MDFKIPTIFAGIVFVLIFFINLIVGNSFLIVMFRSLLSGGLAFLIVFGVMYVFKNVLKIEINSNGEIDNSSDLKSETSDAIDLVVDDNIDTKDYNYNKEKIEIEENKDEEESKLNESELDEKIDSLSNDDVKENKDKDDLFTDISEMKVDDFDDKSLLEKDNFEKESEDENGGNIETETSEIIKDKLGYNATNEEIAKAIRTVLKRDGKN